MSRTDKHFTIKINDRTSTISIDRLKPSFLLNDTDSTKEPFPVQKSNHSVVFPPRLDQNVPIPATTRSGRRVRFNSTTCEFHRLETELEVQAIKVKWNNKRLNIHNAYQPPSNRGISLDILIRMFTDSSFILGDFNAKHPLWGSSVANDRGNELSNLMDDHAFCVLNDKTPTYCSHNYDSRDALDVALQAQISSQVAAGLCWIRLEVISHLSSLNLVTPTKTPIAKMPFSGILKKDSVLRATCVAIPRGNGKKFMPNFIHNSETLLPLLHQRNALQRDFMSSRSPDAKSALNLIINSYIRQLEENVGKACVKDLTHVLLTQSSGTW
ncbi:hypothetical protein TNCT_150771 [Trichonephila clavata]|uniref:Endonuclease/exonuclease/phosphatase domain-containing protein n=1 Tax=Trichonephila clavata TaxID=2740835 RepID=A0A8X6EXG3_TRICU|nr:hypothetical protein TNCT_150771 [Trichonephila clavata]